MVQHDWQPKTPPHRGGHVDIAPPQIRRFNHYAGWTVHDARTTNPDSTDVGTLRGAHEFVDRFTDGRQDRGSGNDPARNATTAGPPGHRSAFAAHAPTYASVSM